MDRKKILKNTVVLGAGLSLSSLKVEKKENFDLKNIIIYKNYLRGCEYYRENSAKLNLDKDLIPELKRESENQYDKFAVAIYLLNSSFRVFE